MSFNWTYLTKTFMTHRYRDLLAVGTIGVWSLGAMSNYRGEQRDYECVMTQMYTHDESDIEFRDPNNMTDQAVRRTKIVEFANNIKAARAQRERELMLDAYNYLNNKNHSIR